MVVFEKVDLLAILRSEHTYSNLDKTCCRGTSKGTVISFELCMPIIQVRRVYYVNIFARICLFFNPSMSLIYIGTIGNDDAKYNAQT